MKIKYIKEDKTLEIKDNLKMYLMLLNLLMIINIVNAVLTFYNNSLAGVKTGWFIMSLGLVSLLVLFFSFSRSTLEKVHLDEIDYVIEKRVFGRKRFSLKLKNGKIRNLYLKKADISEFEKMTDELNIKKSPKIN